MTQTTLLERVKSFFTENEDTDEYKDLETGITLYQDYVNGILIKSNDDYSDDDEYFMNYSDMK